MTTYLDLIKSQHLDRLLETDPTSKFLRSYLQRILPTEGKLPVCSTWEEWQGWLKSQPLTESTLLTSSPCLDYELDWDDVNMDGMVEAYGNGYFQVKGSMNVGGVYEVSIWDLVYEHDTDVRNIVQPIFCCSTVADLDRINKQWLINRLKEVMRPYLIRGVHNLDFDPYDQETGAVNISEVERIDVDYDYDTLQEMLEEFLDELISLRRRQLSNATANHG